MIEYRALGITTLLGPQIDIATDPRWRRTNGTFGEDPALSRDMTQKAVSASQSTYAADGTDLGWGDQLGGWNDPTPVIEAYDIAVDEMGEEAALARYQDSGRRLTKAFFLTGLFDNPYVSVANAKAVVGNAEAVAAGLDAQQKSIVMLKNDGVLSAANAEAEKPTVYIPMVYAMGAASLPVDLKVAEQYFNVITDTLADPLTGEPDADGKPTANYEDIIRPTAEELKDCDYALVIITSPDVGGSAGGYDKEEEIYIPIPLQWAPYTADGEAVREESIAGDIVVERFADEYGVNIVETKENRSYLGESATVRNTKHLDTVLETVALMPESAKVVVAVNAVNPFVPAEFEPSVDALLVGFSVDNSLFMQALTGQYEPTGLLPLGSDTARLNVFGWASVNPVYSGTGSAAAGEAAVSRVTLLQSLESAGYELNGELSKLYSDYRTGRPAIKMNSQDWTLPEPTKAAYTPALLSAAQAFSDVALIVIGRSGGENADLPADMNSVINGSYNLSDGKAIYKDSKYLYGYTAGVYTNNGDYDDFEPGEHYLELSRTEEDLVDTVCSAFEKVIVIINANNAMELGWVEDYPAIKAVILAPGTGDAGMGALGRILNGSVNPSGKTVDTYVYDLTATPTWNHSGNSGNHLLSKAVNPLLKAIAKKDMSFQGVVSFVDYVEGIYMGYKFNETAAEEGLIDFESTVQYPFGYGLSYTSFSQSICDFKQNADSVTLSVEVRNTGSVAGKDVVELYVTPPYTNGWIEKAGVNLVDFAKTGLLEPGASETVSFTVPLESLASYDSGCLKTANGGYVLESGEYVLSVRSDSHTVLDSHVFTVDKDVFYTENGRSDDRLTSENRFGYAEGTASYLSRKDGFANYEGAVAAPDESRFALDDAMKAAIEAVSAAGYDPKQHDDAADVMPTLGSSNGVMLAELSGRSYEYYSEDGVLSGMLASRYSYQLSDTAVRAGRNGRPFRNPPTKRTDAPAGAGASARWG